MAESLIPKWAEGLTHRDRRFVEEYLVDLNPTQAMMRVGPWNQSAGQYFAGETSARAAARLLLAKSNIARAIELALAAESITRQWVIGNYARIINADIAEAFDDDDKLRPLRDIPDDVRFAICGVEFSKDGDRIGVKLADKLAANNALAKVLKMHVDRVEHSGPEGGPVEHAITVEDFLKDAEAVAKRLAESGA